MHYKSGFLSRCAILALALPIAGFSAAISVNGTCYFGDCSSAGLASNAVTLGGSDGGSFNFDVTVGSGKTADIYDVSGTYLDSFPAGTKYGFFPTVTYIGNTSGNAATPDALSQDTLSLDLLEDFGGNYKNWDGSYSETIPLVLPVAGSSASGTLIEDGQKVGVLGPVFGTTTTTLSYTTNLSGLNGSPLVSDYNLNFTFPGGTATPPGGYGSSPAPSTVPEPAQTIPAAMGLVGLLLFKARKIRFGTAN
jgi:hypothetical protein